MTSDRTARRAVRLVEAYQERFADSPGHLQLACHAAFPAALTPDLLYRLAINFQCDEIGNSLPIPWIAVADLLLSGLCSYAGGELYEMKEPVRKELLAWLEQDVRFGPQRVKHLAEFILTYAAQFDASADPELREVAESQKFVAQAYAQPEMAISGLADAIRLASQERYPGEIYRLRVLMDRMAESGEMMEFSGDFRRLQAAATGLVALVEGNGEEAVSQFKAASDGKLSFNVGGVEVIVPGPVQQMAGLDRQPIQAHNKIGYYLTDPPEFGVLDKWIKTLTSVDLPIFMTLAIPAGGSEGFFGFLADRLPQNRTIVVSEYMDDFDVSEHDPKAAAADHWRMLSNRLRPDVPPDFWIEATMDLDPRQADWLGEFALAYADITAEQGLRLALFGFAEDKSAPDGEFWQTPSVRAFLERCAAEPERLAISFREVLDSTVNRAHFFQSGPIENCYSACSRMGLPRPTTFVTELAWTSAQLSATILEGQDLFGFKMPQSLSGSSAIDRETDQAELKTPLSGSFGSHMLQLAEILEAARYYARYPSIRGAALWMKDLTISGDTRVDTRFQRVIETLAERAAEERFEVWPDRPLQPYSELEPLSLTITVQEDLGQDSSDPANWREVVTIDGSNLQSWGEEPMAKVDANTNVRFIWRLQNRGLTTWTPSFSLKREGDSTLIGADSIPLPPAAPGQIVEVSAEFIEPDDVGRLSFLWKPFDDAGRPFLQELVAVVSNLPTFDAAELNPEDSAQVSLVLAPRQQATIHWRLTNTGDTVWDETVELQLFQLETPSDQRSQVRLVEAIGQLNRSPQTVSPGETADIRYAFESPDDRGRSVVQGRLTSPRGEFGPKLALTLTTEIVENNAVALESFLAPEGSTPGGVFPAAWLLKNTGNTTWGEGYSLVGLAVGDRQETRRPLPLAMPGKTAEISFDITVPTEPGRHKLEWELRDQHERPFEVLELRLDVPKTVATSSREIPLYRLISESFASDELHMLATDLDLDYDSLAGNTKTSKALSLQQYMENRGRIGELPAALFEVRPLYDLSGYLYLVVLDAYNSEKLMVGLLERFGLEAQNFGEPERFSWGSRAWRQQKAQALQIFAEQSGRVSELLGAVRERLPEANLSFYHLPSVTFESGQRPPQRAKADFLDFNIIIKLDDSGGYRVDTLSPNGLRGQRITQWPDGLGATATEILEQMREGPEATRQLGNLLRVFLLPGVLWERFQDSHRAAVGGLRLRLRIEPEELRPLPWAYCFEKKARFKGLDPQTPMLQEVPSDRHRPENVPVYKIPQPFRLLIAVTLYDSLSPFDEADLEQALVRITSTGLGQEFRYTFIDDVNLEKLVTASQDNHALQIAGRVTRLSDGRMAFLVEVKQGETQLLPVSDLAAARDWTTTPLVILSGVASDSEEEPEPLHHAAYELVQGGVPAVIVTGGPGHHRTSSEAVVTSRPPLEALYRGLMKGQPLDRLATNMRIAAFTEDDIFWGLPMLYTSVPDAVLWKPLEEEAIEGEMVQDAASITGTVVGNIEGGRLRVEEQVETVSGSVTGATIDNLGGNFYDVNVGRDVVDGAKIKGARIDTDSDTFSTGSAIEFDQVDGDKSEVRNFEPLTDALKHIREIERDGRQSDMQTTERRTFERLLSQAESESSADRPDLEFLETALQQMRRRLIRLEFATDKDLDLLEAVNSALDRLDISRGQVTP